MFSVWNKNARKLINLMCTYYYLLVLLWLCLLSCRMIGVLLAMVVDCVSFYFVAAIDTNFAGGEGEEDCEDFEEESPGTHSQPRQATS